MTTTTKKSFLTEITRSSSDGKSLSMTVRGLLAMIVPLALFVLQGLGVTDIDQAFFDQLVNAIVNTTETATLLVASAMTAFGLLRKLWVSIKKGAGVK